MPTKLADLISKVREAKTATEERGTIYKESAILRTAFKEEDSTFRHRNVAKLLYIHMLGYPSHFGQMECLKLIASSRFLDKRIGYLGLALLVEGNDVLTLVTNSLSSDLNHRNPYVQSLALAALGNISSTEMLRDLSTQVLKALGGSCRYIKKKAALCGIQIIRKVPDMVEDFVPVLVNMLSDRTHSEQLTATTALLEVVKQRPTFIKKVRKAVPELVNILRSLNRGGFSQDNDSARSSDPFLQVQVLRLLSHLGSDRAVVSDEMNDILAQIVANVDVTRNSGSAILYECVRTILNVECEAGLRVLAVNSLGKFLTNRDNNIRYVALNTLGKLVTLDIKPIQRHKNTIVECLRDADVSIRIRAVDIVFAMISYDNIDILSVELLSYLRSSSPEQQTDLSSRMHDTALRCSPDKTWHIHMLISTMCIAGNYTPDRLWQTCVSFIGQPEAEEARPQILHRLFEALQDSRSQPAIVYTAAWTIGEFGSLLLEPAERFEGNNSSDSYEPVTEDEILDILDSVRLSNEIKTTGKGIIMNAYIKLYLRFSSRSRSRIFELLGSYKSSMSLDLQTRSCEFLALASPEYEELLEGWLAQMPVPTDEEMASRRVDMNGNSSDKGSFITDDEMESDGGLGSSDEESKMPKQKKTMKKAETDTGDNLLDLDDIFSGAQNSPTLDGANHTPGIASNQMNLLGEIFGVPNSVPNTPVNTESALASNNNFLGAFDSANSNLPEGVEKWQPIAFRKNDISVDISLARGTLENESIASATFGNSNPEAVKNFKFQVAVPKYCKLKVNTPSGTSLPASNQGQVTQLVHIINSMQGTKPIVMKVRISYNRGGEEIVDVDTIQGFPLGL